MSSEQVQIFFLTFDSEPASEPPANVTRIFVGLSGLRQVLQIQRNYDIGFMFISEVLNSVIRLLNAAGTILTHSYCIRQGVSHKEAVESSNHDCSKKKKKSQQITIYCQFRSGLLTNSSGLTRLSRMQTYCIQDSISISSLLECV